VSLPTLSTLNDMLDECTKWVNIFSRMGEDDKAIEWVHRANSIRKAIQELTEFALLEQPEEITNLQTTSDLVSQMNVMRDITLLLKRSRILDKDHNYMPFILKKQMHYRTQQEPLSQSTLEAALISDIRASIAERPYGCVYKYTYLDKITKKFIDDIATNLCRHFILHEMNVIKEQGFWGPELWFILSFDNLSCNIRSHSFATQDLLSFATSNSDIDPDVVKYQLHYGYGSKGSVKELSVKKSDCEAVTNALVHWIRINAFIK
jgi:hypothetical protein